MTTKKYNIKDSYHKNILPAEEREYLGEFKFKIEKLFEERNPRRFEQP